MNSDITSNNVQMPVTKPELFLKDEMILLFLDFFLKKTRIKGKRDKRILAIV